MPSDRAPTILVVSADSGVRGVLTSVLPLAGWRVKDVPSYTLAMNNLKVALPDVLMMDQKFQDGDPLALMKAFRYVPGNDGTVTVVMVDTIDRTLAVDYVRAGIKVFLAKPLNIVDVCEKLAESVADAGPIEPPPPETDPLARQVIVLATPNLNLREMAEKALSDEFDLVFFDGAQGVEADRRAASVLLIDEGLPGGLEALRNWQTIFGADGAAVAMTSRGGVAPLGYVETLAKPVRDTTLRRVVRGLTARDQYAIFPMTNGVVIRIRDGWQALEEAAFENYLANLDELGKLTKETGRKWLCLDGSYLGAVEHMPRTRALYEAANRPGLHVGLVTLNSDVQRIAMMCNVHATYIHNKTADFIKVVQDLA